MPEALLAAFETSTRSDASGPEETREFYGLVIKAAEAHALAHCNQRLYATDLCRIAGVSERTLQCAFREITGRTPMAYLTRLRLHRARRALQEASASATTVTAVAEDWGFWHMGDFSRLYKQCFDDLPSNALRSPPATPLA